MFSTFDHLNNYQREVWSLINKFDSFDVKSIPYTNNFDINMLIDEASKLNLDDGSINMNFDVSRNTHRVNVGCLLIDPCGI